MKNFCGNNVRWVWTMHKRNTPLSVSTILPGIQASKKHFGYPIALSASWYDNGDVYFDEEEIETIEQFLRYNVQKDFRYADKIEKKIFSLSKEINNSPQIDLHNKSSLQLIALFQKLQRPFIKMIGFMSYRGSVQMGDVMRKRLETVLTYRVARAQKTHRYGQYFENLSVAYFSSVVDEEKKYSLALSIEFDKLSRRAQDRKVDLYLKKYGWLSYHWQIGTLPEHEQLRKRFIQYAEDAKRQLEMLEKEHEKNEKEIEGVLKELHFNAGEKKIVKQYRTWLFLRTFIKDNINKAGYNMMPVLEAIGAHRGIPAKDMSLLTLDEILQINTLSDKKIKGILRRRRHNFSAGVVENKFRIGSLKKSAFQKQVQTNVQNDIAGESAYRGVVKGRVRIMRSSAGQDDLKLGEILVTPMTTPDLLRAMEKSGAFVTDEGGITCHAAIVAREMKKPCIIGTKNATQVLKDGMMVEVDADKGVVKIIEKK